MRQLEMGHHVKNVGGRMHLLLRQDQYVTGLNICATSDQLCYETVHIVIDTLQLGPMQVYVHTLYTSTRVCDDVPKDQFSSGSKLSGDELRGAGNRSNKKLEPGI